MDGGACQARRRPKGALRSRRREHEGPRPRRPGGAAGLAFCAANVGLPRVQLRRALGARPKKTRRAPTHSRARCWYRLLGRPPPKARRRRHRLRRPAPPVLGRRSAGPAGAAGQRFPRTVPRVDARGQGRRGDGRRHPARVDALRLLPAAVQGRGISRRRCSPLQGRHRRSRRRVARRHGHGGLPRRAPRSVFVRRPRAAAELGRHVGRTDGVAAHRRPGAKGNL
mmetsp:Transcript_9860/g.32520  ORF Transcript_9860/g.32520 Transcript_9860/m.32520 type:complete len:225 (+) Transcript_9860:385-1059(+)